MSFQVVNTDKPNSVCNSCVFSLFEAPDNVNLHLALDQYRDNFQPTRDTMEVSKDIKNTINIVI